jgi:erythronate-4-phosphate dehydrogenase
MNFLADENIPLVVDAFSTLGQVRTCSGRAITAADLRDIDVLLVRSVTKVNRQLLAGSSVQFVGTATIGFDHVEREYLQQCGIGFASAPGCNANSAAEYVLSCLLLLATQQQFQLSTKTVGIIGYGQVGSRVVQKLRALGVKCIINDPPLQAQQGQADDFVDLITLLHQADIISLHVPLEKSGLYPTYHLVDAEFLARMQPQTILINTSRGDVIDENALLNFNNPKLILDVWHNEPNINLNLIIKTQLATAHIAGYSLHGKLRGTAMLYQQVKDYFACQADWQPQLPAMNKISLQTNKFKDLQHGLSTAVLACYDPRRDDQILRHILTHPQPAKYFDYVRKTYPIRLEFSSFAIELLPYDAELANLCKNIGFSLF